MSEEQFYLVMVSKGEYSDREETPLGLFRSEEEAKACVTAIEAMIAPIGASYGYAPDKWKAYCAARKEQSEKFMALYPWTRESRYSEPLDNDSRAWLVPIRMLT